MIYKNDSNVKNNSYINKDFLQLWEELLDLIPKLTNKWNPRQANESDPLATLLKVLAIFSDKLNYNIDKSILERFPQTLTELRSAKNVYDVLGYRPPWYKAAVGELTFAYNSKIADLPDDAYFYIPRFTTVCDEDTQICYVLVDDKKTVRYHVADAGKVSSKFISATFMQGKINNYEINGVDKITASNLDNNNRLYFVEPNVAYNGIFISSNKNFTDSNTWTRVENIYQITEEKSYQFDVDPVTGACYIEFPDTIVNTIGDGLYIKYVVTEGITGNVQARSITKFYQEDPQVTTDPNAVVDNIPQESSISLGEAVSVYNSSAILNGSDPATIEEMYKNYKKVSNTFNTLVTLLDYENYIYRYEKTDGLNIVSNIRVSDKTNDLYDTYKIWMLDQNHEILMNQLYDSSDPDLDYNTVRFYPLNPIPTSGLGSADNFDVTFSNSSFKLSNGKANKNTFGDPYAPNNYEGSIISAVNNAKVLTTRIDEIPYDSIIADYDLKGLIYLNLKVSKQAAVEIKDKVTLALRNALNSRQLSFGVEPNYSSILSVISQADDRIDYVSLSPLSFTKVNLPALKFVNNNQQALTDTAKEEVVKQRAILNGNTPWTTFDNTFSYQVNLNDDSIVEITDSPVIIKSSVVLSGQGSTSPNLTYTVLKNEDLVLVAPQYKDAVIYSNYLYYTSTGISSSISADTPYKLTGSERIVFYSTREDALNQRNALAVLQSGDAIRTNFELVNETNSLNNNKLIALITHITSALSDSAIEYITNSATLVDNFENSASSYILRTGEYLLFKNVGESAFTLLGEGNTISNSQKLIVSDQDKEIAAQWLSPTLDWESITEGSIASIQWLSCNGSAISYSQNQIMIFGEGYKFKYSDAADFSGWTGNGDLFNVNSTNLTYSLDDSSYALPTLLGSDSWQGFIRVNYTISNSTDFSLLTVSETPNSIIGHKQQLSITYGEDSSQTVVFDDSTAGSLYIQGNIDLTSPGGINVAIPDIVSLDNPLRIRSFKVDNSLDTAAFYTVLENGYEWVTPGVQGQDVVIFGAYSDSVDAYIDDSQAPVSSETRYYIARSGESLTASKRMFITSNIKIAPKTSNYGWVDDDSHILDNLLPNPKIVRLLDKSELGDKYFNVIHDIPATDLINDPTAAESYFNKNHPLNRYVIAKLNSKLPDLNINQDSIIS